MFQKTMFRSVVQLAGLCLAAFLLSATPVQALDDPECPITFSCTDEATACGLQCGETVTYQYSHTVQHWFWFQGDWVYDPHDVKNYQYGSGIENFECDELAETSSCVCRYR